MQILQTETVSLEIDHVSMTASDHSPQILVQQSLKDFCRERDLNFETATLHDVAVAVWPSQVSVLHT